jgi:hypothetical protein
VEEAEVIHRKSLSQGSLPVRLQRSPTPPLLGSIDPNDAAELFYHSARMRRAGRLMRRRVSLRPDREGNRPHGSTDTNRAVPRDDSEQFRSALRTCCPAYGRLSVRETEWVVGSEDSALGRQFCAGERSNV